MTDKRFEPEGTNPAADQRLKDKQELLLALGWKNLTKDVKFGIMPEDSGPERTSCPNLDSLDAVHEVEEWLKENKPQLWLHYCHMLVGVHDNKVFAIHAEASLRVKCLKTVLLADSE